MKKLFLFVLALITTATAINAQSSKFFKKWEQYDVSSIKVGTDGTKFIKVWGTGSSVSRAIEQAQKNAIHACLIKGIPGNASVNATPALIKDVQILDDNEYYFQNFFKSDYKLYVNRTSQENPSGPDLRQAKGGMKCAVKVQVMYDNLRTRLEQDGIIKGLNTNFEMQGGTKPTIMVVPSTRWCKANRYGTYVDEMGKQKFIPNYQKALESNADVRQLIAKMGDIMAKHDFPLTDLEQTLKKLEKESAITAMTTGQNSGAMVSESAVDVIMRTANPDIILDLDFEITNLGPRKQVKFTVTAIDAYSAKTISGNIGTSSQVSSSIPLTTILEESVLSFMDNMVDGLIKNFDDVYKNGREINVHFYKFDNSPVDYSTEFEVNGGDYELSDIIIAWFDENCVNGIHGAAQKSSSSQMKIDNARIPVMGITGLSSKPVPIDPSKFINPLIQKFKKEYKITVSYQQIGLGEIYIYLGDKIQ